MISHSGSTVSATHELGPGTENRTIVRVRLRYNDGSRGSLERKGVREGFSRQEA